MTDEKRQEIITTTNIIANNLISKKTDSNYSFSLSSVDIEKAFNYYEIIKNQVKSYISNNEFNQDRHKISATSIIAILSYKPIIVDKHPDTITKPEVELWINQILAIAISDYIIFSFLNLPKQKMNYPKNTTSGKPYHDYLIGLINSISDNIQLKESDTPKLANYITSLSHILYLLERYTLDK